MPLAVFPTCYFDDLVAGRMDYVRWIREAATLRTEGVEGVEHYDGFFPGVEPDALLPALDAMRETGLRSAMLCFSPDFTHPDPVERARQIERQREAIDLTLRLGARHCRTLSGQRHPGLTRREGLERAVEAIRRSADYAERRGVVLCLENHYKDGRWRYPEFAQEEELFLEILDRVQSPALGVQYDPSNAILASLDPVRFLERVRHRVVTMHASDRYLEPGATLEDLRAADGTIGYPEKLRHGEIGCGLVDYDAIFRILSEAGFDGWISVEDGLEGLDQLRRSVVFLAEKRRRYWPAD